MANQPLLEDEAFMQSWIQGGYYSTMITDELMLITLNGIYPFTNNEVDITPGTDAMLDWLENLLAANPNTKFITQTHVFFGFNYY